MKWSEVLGWLCVGLGFGFMFGVRFVEWSQGGSEESRVSPYPIFPSMILLLFLLLAAVIMSDFWRHLPGGQPRDDADAASRTSQRYR